MERLLWPGQVMPTGGMAMWVQAPAGHDTTGLLGRARRRGVVFQPGEQFWLDEVPPRHQLRLGLAAIALDDVLPGLQALSESL